MTAWPVRKLRALAEVELGRQRSPDRAEGPNMVPYLRAANVKNGQLDLADVKTMDFNPSEQRTFSLLPGDVLVSEGSGSLGTVGASAVWNAEIDGVVCFQNTVLRLRPKPGNDPRFLMWWARHAYGSGLFASIAEGANIYHLGADGVRTLPAAMPDARTQRAISDYLDAEMARIDRLVEYRQQQLVLLGTRFDASVWHLITGDQHIEARGSGLSWVPRIPSHWATPPVGANFQVQLGKMLNPEAKTAGKPSPYLRNVNVQWDRVDMSDLEEMHFDAADQVRFGLREGDLLVCEGGEVGRAAVWHEEMPGIYYQKALHRVRPYGADSTRFLMYTLMAAAGRGVFENEGNTSTFVHLTAEKLRAYRFPWPPVSEQREIVVALDHEKEAIEAAAVALRRQIGLLLERRQSLITAAVTGQLAIPGVSA